MPRPAFAWHRRLRFVGAFAAIAVGALTVAVPAMSGSGCDAPGSCFAAADGDQLSGPGALADWQSLAGTPELAQQLDPSPDDVFTAGDEGNPDAWAFGTTATVSPAKSDVLGYWASIERSGDSVLADLAFARAPGSGDSFVGIELNQRAAGYRKSGTVAVPTRTDGDLLIDFEMKSSSASVELCRWSGDEHSGEWKPATGAGSDCSQIGAPLGVGATNSAAISAANDYLLPGSPLGVRQFGEASVDLTEVFGEAARACSFGSVWTHTRTSEDANSRPVDYVTPRPLIDDCPPPSAPPPVEKKEEPPPPPPATLPDPVLGSSVNMALVSGDVTVTLPNGKTQTLGSFAHVPVGSVVDASGGVMELTTARNSTGTTQKGRFWGGAFKVRQRHTVGGRTELLLEDTPAAGARASGRAFAARKRKKVWGDAHGNFRTRGRYAAATIRGTKWLTEESGLVTSVLVRRGVVRVRDFRRHKTVTVRTGERYTSTPRVRRAAARFTG
ncbi:MAG: hypothetical protein ACJ76V_07415 [Thermoleophilaceae bacterium]